MILARLLRIAGGIVSVGAGVYLATTSGAVIDLGAGSGGQSWFEVLAHGIGWYFIARGIYMVGETLTGMVAKTNE